ncbi:hypothetical protein SAMN02745121_06392 [Nannocystis exedens]|uniref:Uncharacterized protein n=1 Tax=Nannocystis exedens TaxID=54 RepID=A0A1I2F1M4_9BACT|nr:hypothetical protein [Nannocystis exedens]PCC69583.1 hypothetical protein NAEX_02607 [Nannocystis exedens]SFE98747.1 hypothetical protein SAMN02745121_06392 [Nannocystis exedens]
MSRPSLVDLGALNELDLERWCERTSLSPTIERAADGSIEVRVRGETRPLPPWLVDEAHVLLSQQAPFRAATLAYACSPQEFLLLVKSFVLLKLLRVTGEP